VKKTGFGAPIQPPWPATEVRFLSRKDVDELADEGDTLRYVFLHSLALADLVGILVFPMAYVSPFTQLVVH